MNEIRRRDPVGTRYLHPPKGRQMDGEAPIRLLPESHSEKDVSSADRRHKEEMKNYRYLYDKFNFDSKPWKEHGPTSRWPTGEGVAPE